MKAYITLIIAALFPFFGRSQQLQENWFTVKAFLPQWESARVTLAKNDLQIGSGVIQNELFSFTASAGEPGTATMHLSRNGKKLIVPFFIEPGTIRVRAVSEFNVYVFGTPLNDAYLLFTKQSDSAAAGKDLKASRNIKRDFAKAFITDNPGSLLSLRLLKEYYYLDTTANDSVYFSLYNQLADNLKNTLSGKAIAMDAGVRYYTRTGAEAPAVYVKNILQQQRRLFDKGRMTIIHFYASWCLPCKKEMVVLKQLFAKIPAGGIDLVTVSLDKDFNAFKRSVQPAPDNWKQYADQNAFDGNAAKQYGVKSIPDNFLIGPDGRMIGRHLSVEEIERMLGYSDRK